MQEHLLTSNDVPLDLSMHPLLDQGYTAIRELGQGSAGTVWLCTDAQGRQVALKRFKDTDPEVQRAALREARLLHLARKHPNVVTLFDAFRCGQTGRFYLIFEYLPSTLCRIIHGHPQGLPADALRSVAWQLLQAMSYLHRHKVVHRDLKPANILLGLDGTVKVCDFGFAKVMHTEEPHASKDVSCYVVTRWYRAPELLIQDNTYSAGVDIWSLGCLFLEMATGRAILPGDSHLDQLWLTMRTFPVQEWGCRQQHLISCNPELTAFAKSAAKAGIYAPFSQRCPGVHQQAMDFAMACLAPDPARRLTADQLMDLPYFKGMERVNSPKFGSSNMPAEELVAWQRASRGDMTQQVSRAQCLAQLQQLAQLPIGRASPSHQVSHILPTDESNVEQQPSVPWDDAVTPTYTASTSVALAKPCKRFSEPGSLSGWDIGEVTKHPRAGRDFDTTSAIERTAGGQCRRLVGPQPAPPMDRSSCCPPTRRAATAAIACAGGAQGCPGINERAADRPRHGCAGTPPSRRIGCWSGNTPHSQGLQPVGRNNSSGVPCALLRPLASAQTHGKLIQLPPRDVTSTTHDSTPPRIHDSAAAPVGMITMTSSTRQCVPLSSANTSTLEYTSKGEPSSSCKDQVDCSMSLVAGQAVSIKRDKPWGDEGCCRCLPPQVPANGDRGAPRVIFAHPAPQHRNIGISVFRTRAGKVLRNVFSMSAQSSMEPKPQQATNIQPQQQELHQASTAITAGTATSLAGAQRLLRDALHGCSHPCSSPTMYSQSLSRCSAPAEQHC